MRYPQVNQLNDLVVQLIRTAELQHEYGAKGGQVIIRDVQRQVNRAIRQLERQPIDKAMAKREPNGLDAIRRLRSAGPRRLWDRFDHGEYLRRLEGAFLARCAGCTLGTIVEQWSIERMAKFAKAIGDEFPPDNYWSQAERPHAPRLDGQPFVCDQYTRDGMDGVPPDDDIAYTLMGLLVAEEYGLGFTTADVGEAWVKYLPLAFTAELAALNNIKAGIAAEKAAVKNNPYVQWIGADIRADPWGYMAPGNPELAAEYAYRDAYLSHRRNGIYGEMFFAAAIAAAFVVDDPIAAIRIGLTEIPKDCALARDVRWALRKGKDVKDYRDAVALVDKRFKGMHLVHTNNNACLTIFGLFIGGLDVSRVISQTVAMGYDNDCTAATAGSIVGAVVGKEGIDVRWTRPFGNTVHSYLIGKSRFAISSLMKRFAKQAAGGFVG